MGCKCTADNKENNDLEFQQPTVTNKTNYSSIINSYDKRENMIGFENNNNEDESKNKSLQIGRINDSSNNSINKVIKFKELQKRTKIKQTIDNLSSTDSFENINLSNALSNRVQIPSNEDSQRYLMRLDDNYDLIALNDKVEIKNEIFNYNLLKFINEARTRPYEFSNHIIENLKFIKFDPTQSLETDYLFLKDDIHKVGLKTGKSAFIEAAGMLVLMESLLPLELKEDLIIEIPEKKENMFDKLYIENYLSKKYQSLDYKLFGFH